VNIPLAAWRKHGKNRSIIGAAAYRKDVAEITSELPHINSLKAWLCRFMVTRHALRLAEWHRTPWIYYSMTPSRWKRGMAFRSLSRYGLQYLKSEFVAARRQARKTLPV
jgi:hypothetical protein